MSFDLMSYKPLFLSSAREHTATLNNLLSKENLLGEDITLLHISAHSLKGQSNAMGYEKLSTLCLSLEKYFEEKKEHKDVMTEHEKETLLQYVRTINSSLDLIESEDREGDVPSFVQPGE